MTDKSGRFSIQKHESVDLHYVFNLEVDGETRSWAVPRGPSPDPRVKRLAIPISTEVEMDFEGVDGSQNKRVIVWDSGDYATYELDGEPLPAGESLLSGKLEFWIEGKKLQGGFTLLRIEEGTNERWLLMKMTDAMATSRRNPVMTEPLSVVSGKDLEDVTLDE
jgi:DNA ligase D-like protein (predicted 3'-phosphoesterase)